MNKDSDGMTFVFWQDKGQNNCTKEFVDAIENGKASPIPFDEIIEVSRATIKADLPEQNK